MTQIRTFLFLQGVCSPFFSRLADQLKRDGHQVYKINFNAGDWLYWSHSATFNYQGLANTEHQTELRDFLDNTYQRLGITDQILFGDRRPVHRVAVSHGESCNVRTHVYEEGYFRPYWVTLEREGVNGHSLLPRDPDWFWEVGAQLIDTTPVDAFQTHFNCRAFHDVAYHLAGLLNPILFSNYQTHAPVIAPIEYIGYMRRLPLLRFCKTKDQAVIDHLIGSTTPYYFLPLQLGSDAQIRDHSRFDDMVSVIEFVMESFARYAPSASHLLIKNHPLDMWLVNYRKVIHQLSVRFDLLGRVDYIETGYIEPILQNAQGTVTVNSTVGAVSLGFNCPTIALSDPIYNLPQLTFQGSLDAFWCEGSVPNQELFRRFRNTLLHTTQVNGGFYCAKGIELAVKNSLQALTSERSLLESLL